jgi:hypothetical protein
MELVVQQPLLKEETLFGVAALLTLRPGAADYESHHRRERYLADPHGFDSLPSGRAFGARTAYRAWLLGFTAPPICVPEVRG